MPEDTRRERSPQADSRGARPDARRTAMVGPVMRVLMRHLASSSVENAALELGRLQHEPLGPRSPAAALEAAALTTPQTRNLVPGHAAGELELNGDGHGVAGWWGVDGGGEGFEDVILGEEELRGRSAIDLDDGFALPPPAIGVDEQMSLLPFAFGDEPGLGYSGALAAAMAAVGGGLRRAAVEAPDSDSTPDLPWTAPHTRRCSSPGSPGLTAEGAAAGAGGPAASARCEALAEKFAAKRHGELLAASVERWAQAAAAAVRRRAAAPRPPPALVFGPAPPPLRKPLPGVRPMPVARPPLGCCQAVRVGRRRVAMQRAPRQVAGGPGGRRCPPCGGGAAARR